MPDTPSRRRLPGELVVVFVLALLLQGVRCGQFEFPPDNDPAYYLLVARNLASGRGLVQDVVWHYLRPVEAVTGPSNDYWMPLTSVLVAPFLAIQDSYRMATLPVILLGAVAATLCCATGTRALGDRALGVACGVALLLPPSDWLALSTCDSVVPYLALLLAAFLLHERVATAGGGRAAFALGIVAGLATLTRSDALPVLCATALLATVLSKARAVPRPPGRAWLLCAVGFAITLAPWCLRSAIVFGRPWNPASSASMFLLDYTDLYAWRPPGPGEYWRHVAEAPFAVAGHKLATALRIIAVEWPSSLGWPLAAAGLPGLVSLLRRREPSPLVLVHVSFVASVALVYGGLTDVLGLNVRNHALLFPLALLSIAETWRLVASRLPGLRDGTRGARVLAAAAVLYAGGWSLRYALNPVRHVQSTRQRAACLRGESFLRATGYDAARPIMTVQPWQWSYATGRPAIVLPSDGPEAAREAARRFGARFLALDGYFLHHPRYRPFLELYAQGAGPPGFRLVWTSEELRLFAIEDR